MAAWQGCVLRRQQLEELLQQGLIMSERLAAKAAFRGWQEVSQRQAFQGQRWSARHVVKQRNCCGQQRRRQPQPCVFVKQTVSMGCCCPAEV